MRPLFSYHPSLRDHPGAVEDDATRILRPRTAGTAPPILPRAAICSRCAPTQVSPRCFPCPLSREPARSGNPG